MVKVLWYVGEGIDSNSVRPIPIGEVRDVFKILLSLDGLEELEQGSFCGVSPDDIIDERILLEDRFMIISGRKPTEDDRDLRMKVLDDFSYGQCSLDMGHPMEINTKGNRFFLEDEPFNVEPLILEHFQGDVDNSYFHTVPLQIFREAGKPDRIHFKDGSGGDDITDRAMDPGFLSEVVEGWGMKQDKVNGH
jgi:hypothetical protein